jgi:uncharacterized protein YdaU (DUF1376 family)
MPCRRGYQFAGVKLFYMKDPAFLFYPSDFLTGTMFMNNEQIGIYIRLLCSQHQHGGIIDKVSFNSLVGENQLIKSKFIETETGFYNERLTGEMEKRNKKSTNMSETAKEVWAKRKELKNTIVLQKQNKSKTKVKKNDTIVMQTVNVNEDINYYIKFDHLELSNDEFKKLIDSGFTKAQIDETIESIQNYKKNTNYVSLYLTLKKWIKSEQGTTAQPVQRTSMKFS